MAPADRPTVLIGIEDTSMSWAVFCWGCGEARRLRGRVVVALVGSPAAATSAALCSVAGLAGAGFPEPNLNAAKLDDLAAEMWQEAADLDLTVMHALPGTVAELLRIAEEVRADMIVVGGSTATPRRLAGLAGRRRASRLRRPVIVAVPAEFDVPDQPEDGGRPRTGSGRTSPSRLPAAAQAQLNPVADLTLQNT